MSNSQSSNNKRIAKNTILLYFRMFLTMAISLYTSRVVLEVLGVEDFGIYNVVGGIVAMLAFFNSSLATSTQRFLNYAIGRNETENLKTIFSNAKIAHILIGVITIFIVEIIGLWLIYNKLDIPKHQFDAAIYVFHFSVASFFITIISSPYNAAIIAHERMDVYAYFSIFEVILKLLVVYFLYVISYNKLVVYGILQFSLTLIIRFAYNWYCTRNFYECKGKYVFSITIFKQLFVFSGWMIFGCVSDTLSKQGINVLINVFFGPALNASRAIAIQVQSAVNVFVTNFMTAVKPQIIKSYAAKEYEGMYKLVFSSSKFSYYLLLLLSLPILYYTEYLLMLWLKNPPEQSVIFTQLVVIELLISSSYVPIAQINQASGKIKNYQLSISVIYILTFMLSYILFYIGKPAYYTFIVSIFFATLGLFVRLFVLKYENKFPVKEYLFKVTIPLIVPTVILFCIYYVIKQSLNNVSVSSFVLSVIAGTILSIFIIYCIGLNNTERVFLKKNVMSIYKKIKI